MLWTLLFLLPPWREKSKGYQLNGLGLARLLYTHHATQKRRGKVRTVFKISSYAVDNSIVGSSYNKANVLVSGKTNESREIILTDMRNIRDIGKILSAAIPRDNVDVLHRWALRQFPSQAMLASSFANEKDFEV